MNTKTSFLILTSLLLTAPILAFQQEGEGEGFFSNPFNFLSARPEEKEETADQTLISQLNGIVLVGSFEALDRRSFKDVTGVEIVDLDVPGSDSSLKNYLSSFLNQPLMQRDLYRMERAIIAFYQENKHPLVMVKVPQQETKGGVLQVVVLESVLGKLESTGAKWFSNKKIAQSIRLKPGQLIDEGTLLQDLFWINRNSFRRTSAIYKPGEEDATTDIELITQDRFPLRSYVGTDNTGLDPIQRNRIFAGLSWGNAFSLGHILTYQYTAAYSIRDFQAHTLYYSAPLSWRHVFTVFGGYSSVHADIPITGFKSSGSSYQASGRYTIPVPTSTKLLNEVTFGFDFKRTNNTVDFSETPVFGKLANLTQFMGEYSLGYEGSLTKTSFVLDLFFSPAEMVGDQSRADFESLRPYAKTKYVYGRAFVSEAITFKNVCTLVTTFRGQLSSGNLLPSEQLGIGGYDTVRGYEERILNYDNGLITNFEFRTPSWRLISRKYSKLDEGFQLLAFFDYGVGHNCRRVEFEKFSRFLMSVGAGVRYNINPYLSIRYDYGIKLHKIVGDGSFGRPHFSVTAGY